jgi:hypothetical protein
MQQVIQKEESFRPYEEANFEVDERDATNALLSLFNAPTTSSEELFCFEGSFEIIF